MLEKVLVDKGSLRAVAWTKPDLQNKNVYLYRDGRFDPADQNPSFKNRVDLQDRQMKDGDVSLILKDVMINDAGKYECSVTQKKDLSPFTTTITLDLRINADSTSGNTTNMTAHLRQHHPSAKTSGSRQKQQARMLQTLLESFRQPLAHDSPHGDLICLICC
uniref:Ig-like domain-containing protein n=1 Tax=Maylandia zebra TaxID=106582 RepID=A0A3P9DTM4_9CICH